MLPTFGKYLEKLNTLAHRVRVSVLTTLRNLCARERLCISHTFHKNTNADAR